jgi:hypothetical protein
MVSHAMLTNLLVISEEINPKIGIWMYILILLQHIHQISKTVLPHMRHENTGFAKIWGPVHTFTIFKCIAIRTFPCRGGWTYDIVAYIYVKG